MSPSEAGSTTASTSPEKMIRSGATSSKVNLAMTVRLRELGREECRSARVHSGPGRRSALRRFGGETLGLFDGLFDRPDHVKRGFGEVIVLAFDQALEALHR